MQDKAFEQAVLEHKDRVGAYAAMMLGDSMEAQDVAQEAMIRLWRNRGGVDERGARPWLMRTVHNLCIDLLRKRKVRSEVDEGEKVVNGRAGSEPDALQLAESGETGRTIRWALENMAEQDRAVLVMREVQGLPYDEIAKSLDLPLGTLKARLHRARDRLRAKLIRVGVTP
jgi:RNA polymerase sigma-70 factor (ECF subfamily)